MRKRLGDFFLEKVPARNQKESKGMSWPCLGQILDTPQTPSGCLRDGYRKNMAHRQRKK